MDSVGLQNVQGRTSRDPRFPNCVSQAVFDISTTSTLTLPKTMDLTVSPITDQSASDSIVFTEP